MARQLNTPNAEDVFECAVARYLGERIRTEDATANAMWSALADTDWVHANGDTASYTFRAAGDLVAAVRGAGDYLDWYCRGPYGVVSQEIASGLAGEGWSVAKKPAANLDIVTTQLEGGPVTWTVRPGNRRR